MDGYLGDTVKSGERWNDLVPCTTILHPSGKNMSVYTDSLKMSASI